VAKDDPKRRFELLALPHLDAAYNLARWLTGNATDAEDVVQDAYLRAFRYFHAFRGDNFRVWLLAIVRNTFVTWVKDNRSSRLLFQQSDSERDDVIPVWTEAQRDPEAMLIDRVDKETITRLLAQLPVEYREILILREIEELSYKDIAQVTEIPTGTVMSRLSRARLALRKAWLAEGVSP
jgi:RNA polymerase sigma factor (sigma-70 family)